MLFMEGQGARSHAGSHPNRPPVAAPGPKPRAGAGEKRWSYMPDDAPAAKKEYTNRVIWHTVFTLKEGTPSVPPDKDQWQIVRSFRHTVVDEANAVPYESEDQDIQIEFPLSYFDPDQPVCVSELKYLQALAADPELEKTTPAQPADKLLYLFKDIRPDRGCSHYCTGALMKCEACAAAGMQAYYPCRFCHMDAVADHDMEPNSVTTMKCLSCGAEGPIGLTCSACKARVADYHCPTCNILTNVSLQAVTPYHCEKCGHCGTHPAELSKHCDSCNRCYPLFAFSTHECTKNYGACIICMDNLDESIRPFRKLPCKKHYCHLACLEAFKQQPNYDKKCPLCKKNIEVGDDSTAEASD